MKLKVNYLFFILIFSSLSMLSSCLKRDLKDYPLFEANLISLVSAEHRFNGTGTLNGQPVVAYQRLTSTTTVDTVANTANVTLTVPAPNGQFTAAERANVVQTKLWFYINISTAATIRPLDGTPALGDPTDATKPLKYEVTAANGAKRVWTVNVTAFNK